MTPVLNILSILFENIQCIKAKHLGQVKLLKAKT